MKNKNGQEDSIEYSNGQRPREKIWRPRPGRSPALAHNDLTEILYAPIEDEVL